MVTGRTRMKRRPAQAHVSFDPSVPPCPFCPRQCRTEETQRVHLLIAHPETVSDGATGTAARVSGS